MTDAHTPSPPTNRILPVCRDGVPGWSDQARGAEIRFLGRRPDGRGAETLPQAWLAGVPLQARMRQVHGAQVLAARAGDCGAGDAMVTVESGLALVVVTADCVPVLLAAPGKVAAIHAGWRGFVGGVVAAALAQFAAPGEVTAWIGPAIGPCCYEVGEEVATPVVARSSLAVRAPGTRGRPHLDLPLAVEIELARHGVVDIRRIACCTACHPRALESFRRDGSAASRNASLIWLAVSETDRGGTIPGRAIQSD